MRGGGVSRSRGGRGGARTQSRSFSRGRGGAGRGGGSRTGGRGRGMDGARRHGGAGRGRGQLRSGEGAGHMAAGRSQYASRHANRGRRDGPVTGFYRGDRQAKMYPGLSDGYAAQQAQLPTVAPPFAGNEFDPSLTTTQHDMRPEGINEKQDDVICYTAKYVVYSCDGAKYQQRLRLRTRHNPYFAFMDPRHPYYRYYAYLMESYRYHKDREEGGGGFAEEGNFAADTALAMMGQGTSAYHMYDGVDDDPSYGGDGTMGYSSAGGGAEGHDESETVAQAACSGAGTAQGVPPTAGASVEDGVTTGQLPAPAHSEEDEDEDVDDDQFEMVMVNGVPTLVPKKA